MLPGCDRLSACCLPAFSFPSVSRSHQQKHTHISWTSDLERHRGLHGITLVQQGLFSRFPGRALLVFVSFSPGKKSSSATSPLASCAVLVAHVHGARQVFIDLRTLAGQRAADELRFAAPRKKLSVTGRKATSVAGLDGADVDCKCWESHPIRRHLPGEGSAGAPGLVGVFFIIL